MCIRDRLDNHQTPTNTPVPTYAQVVNMVNLAAGETDTLISAAGGLPGEVAKGWRVKAPNTFDLEFGFSCMGYEIAAGWGLSLIHIFTDLFDMIERDAPGLFEQRKA